MRHFFNPVRVPMRSVLKYIFLCLGLSFSISVIASQESCLKAVFGPPGSSNVDSIQPITVMIISSCKKEKVGGFEVVFDMPNLLSLTTTEPAIAKAIVANNQGRLYLIYANDYVTIPANGSIGPFKLNATMVQGSYFDVSKATSTSKVYYSEPGMR